MRAPWGTAGAVAIMLAATTALTPAGPVAATPAEPRGYYWEWDDGSRATSRTFAQARYGVAGNLPRLVVTALMAEPKPILRRAARSAAVMIFGVMGRSRRSPDFQSK